MNFVKIMKKIILALIILCISATVFSINISDCTGLQSMSGANSYTLTGNIDCTATNTWNSGAGFAPITSFTGTLNGAGYTIRGLYINRTGSNSQALIGTSTNATLTNIVFEDANIAMYNYGGVLLANGSATISNITVRNSIIRSVGNVGYVGGIAGNYTGGQFTNSSIYGSVVSGPGYVGGLIGKFGMASNNASIDINDCYADLNSVTSSGDYVGGIVGQLTNTGTGTLSSINRSTAVVRTLFGYSYVGGIVGSHVGAGGTISDVNITLSSWSLRGSSFARIGGIAGNLAGTLTRSFAIINLDINNTSASGDYVGGLVGYGLGSTISDSYADVNIDTTISNAERVNAYVGGIVGYGSNIYRSYARGYKLYSGQYTGMYVGGLAGRLDGNISDSNATFTSIIGGGGYYGDGYVGGLVGYFHGNYIIRSKATANLVKVTRANSVANYAGGLIGGISTAGNKDINNCTVDVNNVEGFRTSNGSDSGISGLIGFVANVAGIHVSINQTSVRSKLLYATGDGIGGFIGYMVNSSGSLTITDSNATIERIHLYGGAGYGYVGGLIGRASVGRANITNSFAISQIDINLPSSSNGLGYVGGLAGAIGTGNVSDSWADTNVNGNFNTYSPRYVGGLIGSADVNLIRTYARGTYLDANKSGGYYVGGLAGACSWNVTDSNATFERIDGSGSYYGDAYIAGLVGSFTGNYILRSKAIVTSITAPTYPTNFVGGLVGGIGVAGNKDINYCSADVNIISATKTSNGSTTGVGGLIGFVANVAINLSINNSSARTGTIYGIGDGLGGLLGYMVSSSGSLKIIDSNAITDRIYFYGGGGSGYFGGLAGRAYAGRVDINNSFAISQIDVNATAGLDYVGGLAGEASLSGLIYNSWADTNINGSFGTYSPGNVGGLFGSADVNIIQSYARGNYIKITKANGSNVGGFAGKLSGDVLDSNVVFVDINGSSSSYGYGYVGGFVGYYTGGYILRSKVNAVHVTGYRADSLTDKVGGFIGYVRSTKATDINDCFVTVTAVRGYKNNNGSSSNVGGLIGDSYGSYPLTINHSFVNADLISATSSEVGGLVGNSNRSPLVIMDSNAVVRQIVVTGTPGRIGGLVGSASTNSLITNTYASSNLILSNSSVSPAYYGGLIGHIGGGLVTKSYADTNIDATIGAYSGSQIGGLIGYSAAQILNTYAHSGYIMATKSYGSRIGGLVGHLDSTVTNSYAIVDTDVNGVDNIGGVAGYVGNTYSVNNSFFVGRAKATSTPDNNIVGNASASNVVNCYFYKTGAASVCSQSGTTVTCGIDNPSMTDYFKGKTSTIRLRAPFSGGAVDWNFNYTGHAGVWYGWYRDYPHFILDPTTPHVPVGEYKSVPLELATAKKCQYIDFNFVQVGNSDVNIQIQIGDLNAAMWDDSNWFGPDGTSSTAYTLTSDKNIPSSKGNGKWIRWKAMLYASTEGETPALKSVDFNCIPIGEMVLVANADLATWYRIDYNEIFSGTHGTVDWLYNVGFGWGTITLNSFPPAIMGSPLYLKAKIAGRADSNVPAIDNNIMVAYRVN